MKKTIAFSHNRDVHLSIDYDAYEDNTYLPEGTKLSIARFNITGISEFASEKKELGKPKVSLNKTSFAPKNPNYKVSFKNESDAVGSGRYDVDDNTDYANHVQRMQALYDDPDINTNDKHIAEL